MMESPYYRDNLEQILAFTNGRQLLTVKEVMDFCGFVDRRTAHRHFPFIQSRISAATFARCLCQPDPAARKRVGR